MSAPAAGTRGGVRAALGQGLRRATRWRLLLLAALVTALPAALATLPIWGLFSHLFDHAPRAELLARGLELSWLPELGRALAENASAHAIPGWTGGALVVAMLLAPVLAGAVLAESASPVPLRLGPLLAEAGRLYGRMLRTTVVGAVPLGLSAAAIAAISGRTGEAVARVTTEAAAVGLVQRAFLLGGAILVVAHLTVDAGRARFAAEPGRRSALVAWLSGTWLVLRHPLRSAVVAGAGLLLGPFLALVVMAVRERLPAGPSWAVVAGVLLAQLAAVAVGWGRAVRVAALVRLAGDDREARLRRRAAPSGEDGQQREDELR